MAVVKELLRTEPDGSLSFGNYEEQTKQKLSDYEYQGSLCKVKTFRELTRLEINETFVYESVPGTTVPNMKISDAGMAFDVEGPEDAQITLGVEEDTDNISFYLPLKCGQCPLLYSYNEYLKENKSQEVRPVEMKRILSLSHKIIQAAKDAE